MGGHAVQAVFLLMVLLPLYATEIHSDTRPGHPGVLNTPTQLPLETHLSNLASRGANRATTFQLSLTLGQIWPPAHWASQQKRHV